ncbi:LptA/OstA family protein [Rhizobium sullae]|uniref:LPS ABC transporter substrate-binding protein LptA n=1 Tax=Rhizobium sullae TaxID=50338 RepID=A0A2N0DDV2_RHISU|nr:LptA/OstA family protein [Rhizobium sullae]PKA44270.1 LPS ABC transporter substrate-binding protein LptA [Rhizobium sullae]UWU14510.1 LptA/OstA family protein [Rhizobium sullae]
MTIDCHFSIRKSGVTFARSAIALLLVAGAAFAQATTSQMDGLKLDSNQPIQIESDKLEIQDQEHKADFTGNVKVVQGKTTLQAGHMTVFYKAKAGDSQPAGAKTDAGAASISSGNADIDRIIVTDKVFLSSGTQTATADNGSFDMAQQLFVLKGDKVVLSDGPNVFTGCQLTVYMQTGRAQLDSCGGRVQIQLDPKSQKKN